MPADTKLNDLIINKLTTAKYEELVENDQINDNELYLTTDTNYPTEEEIETALAGKQDVLTAGTGISISNNVISSTQVSAEWGNITGTLSDQTDLNNVLGTKADVATTLAGYGIVDSYTKDEIDSLLVNKQDELSQNQLNAVNSGITFDKVSTYDGYAAQINAKADANDVYTKTYIDNTYATISSLTNHTSDTTIHVTSSDKTNWNNKATIVFREWS